MSSLVVNRGTEEVMRKLDLENTLISRMQDEPTLPINATGFVTNSAASTISPLKARLVHLFVELVHCRYLHADPESRFANNTTVVGRNFNFSGMIPSDANTAAVAHTAADLRMLRAIVNGTWEPPASDPGARLDNRSLGVAEGGIFRLSETHHQVQNRLKDQFRLRYGGKPEREVHTMAVEERMRGYPWILDARNATPPASNAPADIARWRAGLPRATPGEVMPHQLGMIYLVEETYRGQLSFSDKTPVWKTRLVPQALYILQDPTTTSELEGLGPMIEFTPSKRPREEDEDSSPSSKRVNSSQ
ncbi:uncharacterized protein J4E87_010400 [Alternaria ethzedia]|uniref:uncharacterized protein n=1 Tax=Alternaria ethzedia TaxID=181014 RepID=UPI0020C295B5|nr:uncharacterized protein J4E87_010400 [Alternaria ethzedia]KAI4611798.1 hypothetical protein J4E87_010400 [Alternaria ethzedia]